ncbi:hypothetical protein [Sphingomonas sp. RB1R13]|uniref:hypothetical protein n=1 Tax=Sphingomonas sp. RB1R13 TaxID=3096159 RepID=UPI002FC8B6AB
MKRAKTNRPDATGRDSKRLGSDGAVIILRRSFWLSPQVSALSVTARALLVELTAMYTGPACNGKLFLSQVDAAHRLGLSDRKAVKSAFDELEGLGFLRCTVKGDFRIKAGGFARASAFWLNWKSKGGSSLGGDVIPKLNFGDLDARQRRRVSDRSNVISAYTRAFFAGEDSSHWATIRADMGVLPGEETSHANAENGGNALPSRWEESSQHVYYQGGRGRTSLTDMMHGIRGKAWTPPFVRSPEPGKPLFCDLIKLRRSINQTPEKMGPTEFRCEQCGDPLIGGRLGRRYCNEACRKRGEGKRRYERMKVAA